MRVARPRWTLLILDFKRMRFDGEGQIDKSDRLLSHAIDAEGYRVWCLRPIWRPRPGVDEVVIGE